LIHTLYFDSYPYSFLVGSGSDVCVNSPSLPGVGGRGRSPLICTFSDRPNIGQMHRPDPTWPQHWPDLGSRPASKAQMQPNLDHSWTHLAPTSAQLGSNMAKMRSIWLQHGGHSRSNPKSSKRPFSLLSSNFLAIDDASLEAMFPMLCLRCAQLGAKLSPKCPKLRNVAHDLDVHDRSGPASAQHDQAAPTWAPVGFKIAQVGPKLPNPLKTCIFTASSNLFWL